MNINGFQKMTLLDFPGKVACTLFTGGCNMRCPFCHNASLVINGRERTEYSEEEILSYLKKRQGILEGVCITGGEPLLQPDIEQFIIKVRELGYAIKLDTNGALPERLISLCEKGLVDYVAMDIKNSIEKYRETSGVDTLDTKKIEQSIDFLLSGTIDYEFRTTVVNELHTIQDIEALSKRISGAKRYFLQPFLDSGDIIGDNLSSPDKVSLEEMCKIASKYVHFVEIRG